MNCTAIFHHLIVFLYRLSINGFMLSKPDSHTDSFVMKFNVNLQFLFIIRRFIQVSFNIPQLSPRL